MQEERSTMTRSQPNLVLLGPIVRLQVQSEKIKTGNGIMERYTPQEHLKPVQALRLDTGGVAGLTVDGKAIEDVHHRDHPRSRFRGSNGISLLTTGHYTKMREQFGGHVVDGIAAESVLVDCDRVLTLADLSQGVVIGEGDDAIEIQSWVIAHPCSPFARFTLDFPDDAKPDRRIKEALQLLDDGTRGFYGILADQPGEREIRLGDMVYLRG